MFKKIILGVVALTSFLVIAVFLLIHFNVIWKLAPHYEIESYYKLEVPVMGMEEYMEIWNDHRRPYIYNIVPETGGEVYIVGIEHSKDLKNPELDSINYYWNQLEPDLVLVEGIVGNLFSWFQNPVEELGEGGFVTNLAHKNDVVLYSWEPKREEEIAFLLESFSPEELSMFYSFRPYFGNMRYGSYSNPEAQLQNYLLSRTDYPGLKGVFTSWKELDQKWSIDFPDTDWRNYGSGKAYPEGYLTEIWNQSNLFRDIHMMHIIREEVQKNNKVFVTMGVSHAPRIEKALRAFLN